MTGKKFERTTPEAVGISSKSLEQLIENLERVTEMHGIMIMRHEKICAEGWWAPYAPGIRHSLHSLSKTYSATAIGIAVTEGKVFLDEKILSIFPEKAPENPDENLKQLTVKDILCMGREQEKKELFMQGRKEVEQVAGNVRKWSRCIMGRCRESA